jgi:hypothetical protein
LLVDAGDEDLIVFGAPTRSRDSDDMEEEEEEEDDDDEPDDFAKDGAGV